MSWLAHSIADSLRIDDDEEEEENSATPIPKPPQSEHDDENEENRSARGVREYLSEFTETLTRQLWASSLFSLLLLLLLLLFHLRRRISTALIDQSPIRTGGIRPATLVPATIPMRMAQVRLEF
ncbi:hypothetical protein HYC85_001345 [Camellia sinensis]|uniref:Uncharacterized protein n=1 Tax=Camellia sinensis TaxID=4442 RepID=A0A7J7I6L4_CAMSI|nr:hypothetical protein HYC85_001345 [Camellia sinensis]